MDVALHHQHARLEVAGHAAQVVGIDLHPGLLHRHQHGDEPALHLLIQRQRAVQPEPRAERLPQPQRDVRGFGGLASAAVDRRLCQRQSSPTGAGNVVERDRRVAEMELSQFFQPVAVQPALLAVGDQHGVIDRPSGNRTGGREAGARQHLQVELGVLEDLQHAGVGQHGGQRGDRGLGRHLLDQDFVPQRDVAGAARCDGQSDPQQGGAHRVRRVRAGLDRQQAAIARAIEEAGQRIRCCNDVIGAERDRPFRGSRRGRRYGPGPGHQPQVRLRLARCLPGARFFLRLQPEPYRDAAEPHRPEPRLQPRLVQVARRKLVDRQRHRRVGTQGDQLAGQPRRRRVLDQHVPPLRRLHGCGRRQHRLQVAELVDELRRGLWADPRNTRNIVGRVADQRLHLDHLVRGNAELLHHLHWADRLLLDRVQQFHAGADKLHQVFVGRHYRHLSAGIGRSLRVGGDQVVRFPVGQFDSRHAESLGRLPHQGELRDQVVGRRRAVRLVVLEHPVAERHPPGIEDHRQVRADMLPQQLSQHVGEAEHRVHRHPVRAVHRRQGMERAEDEA